MKKVFLLILAAVIAFSFTACSIFEKNQTAVVNESNNSEYILTSELCFQFFGYGINEIEQALIDSDIINGHFQSAEVLDDNNIK